MRLWPACDPPPNRGGGLAIPQTGRDLAAQFRVRGMPGLTLPSSGLAPAGRATLPRHFTFRAACRCEPLMSNVRHRNVPVQQDRALKAKSSMPFKRSLTISRQLNGCELVVGAKQWQNIEQAQCKVATSCNVHAPGGGATELLHGRAGRPSRKLAVGSPTWRPGKENQFKLPDRFLVRHTVRQHEDKAARQEQQRKISSCRASSGAGRGSDA